MKFSGFEKTDLVNFPSCIAATVFVRGCNFRCPYCHNVTLVNPREFTDEEYPEELIFDYLNQRKNFLDGIVVTGGEPTLYKEIPQFIKKVKEMGFKVKLDTNGTNPEMVRQLINDNLLDYVAMDIKAPLDKYEPFTGGSFVDMKALIGETMEILRNSNVSYEFRTTCPKDLLTIEDFDEIAKSLKDNETWFLQEFNPKVTLDESFGQANSYSAEELEAIAAKYKMAKVRK